jgi:hypothetical protein
MLAPLAAGPEGMLLADGSGSLPKGLLSACWTAEAEARKPTHGLQTLGRPEGAITDSPLQALRAGRPKKKKITRFLFKNGSKYPVGLDICLLIWRNQKIKILLLGLH